MVARRKGREIMAALVRIAPDIAQWKEELARFDGEIARLEGGARDGEQLRHAANAFTHRPLDLSHSCSN